VAGWGKIGPEGKIERCSSIGASAMPRVGACLHQQPRHLDMPEERRKMQGRRATGSQRGGVGPEPYELPHRGRETGIRTRSI